MAIDFTLTDEQERVRQLCHELGQDFATRALEHDRDRSIPEENFEKLRDAGLFGIAMPKDFGGLGIGTLGYITSIAEIARGDAATALAFNMHANATGGILQNPEVPIEAKRRVATLAVDEGRLMCTSVSEPTTSSLLPGSFTPAVEAEKVQGGYRINGRKFFCSNFEGSEHCYLYVHPKGNPNPGASLALLVPTDSEGITVTDVWHTMGMRSTRSNQIDYVDVFVPDEVVLYETEDFLGSFIIGEANWSFGGFVGCYLGLGLGIVDWVKDQLSTRTAKGYAQPTGYAPTTSVRFGKMVADIESARFMVYRAAWQQDTFGPSPETFHWWVRAKLVVGNALQEISSNATVACGLHALFQPLGLEKMLRDAATAPIMPPNSDAAATMVGLLSLGLDPAQAPSLRMATPEPVPVGSAG